jgi:hypothetical protein
VSGSSSHEIEQFWHFAPDVQIEIDGDELTARIKGRNFAVHACFVGSGLKLELIRGMENPPLGWYSKAYESKQPSPVIRISCVAVEAIIQARFKVLLPN